MAPEGLDRMNRIDRIVELGIARKSVPSVRNIGSDLATQQLSNLTTVPA